MEHVHEYDDVTGEPTICPVDRCGWNAEYDVDYELYGLDGYGN